MSEQSKPIQFTAVDHRDGEQQHISLPNYETNLDERTSRRIEIFDTIVDCGIDRIEIGHLGNPVDQHFAQNLIAHINHQENEVSEIYKTVQLQVLFGSQEHIISDHMRILSEIDPDRVVVHVYDRIADSLRALAAEPYSLQESADRVSAAAKIAIDAGFTNISVSGEGATDATVEQAAEFYNRVVSKISDYGARDININLANTFGYSPIGEWDQAGLSQFNQSVKEGAEASTSVHTHDDYASSAEFSMAAIRAGFDRVEGTMNGMGERTGNVSISNVIARLIEDAMMQVKYEEQSVALSQTNSLIDWSNRHMTDSVITTLPRLYQNAAHIGAQYGTEDRFSRTILGSEAAFTNGSGPHDQATAKAFVDPVSFPLWRNYGSSVPVHAVLGRPEALAIVSGNTETLKDITVGGHAGGGNTQKLTGDRLRAADEVQREIAREEAAAFMQKILAKLRQ